MYDCRARVARGVLHDRAEKQRRIEHLGLDAELVHMREPGFDAEHFARFLRGVGADVTVFAVRPSFDHPKVAHGKSPRCCALRAEALGHQLRRKAPLLLVKITPGLHRLDTCASASIAPMGFFLLHLRGLRAKRFSQILPYVQARGDRACG